MAAEEVEKEPPQSFPREEPGPTPVPLSLPRRRVPPVETATGLRETVVLHL